LYLVIDQKIVRLLKNVDLYLCYKYYNSGKVLLVFDHKMIIGLWIKKAYKNCKPKHCKDLLYIILFKIKALVSPGELGVDGIMGWNKFMSVYCKNDCFST